MDMRQIMYFMRVFEEKSFTKGAERANVVQPALSRQIAFLEKELNAKLFVRGPHGVTPTGAAIKLYECVFPIVGALASIKEEIRALADVNVSGTIACGFPPTFNRAVVGKVLVEFVEKYPEVDIQISEDFSAKLTDQVQEGSLDFALGIIPQEPSAIVTEFVRTDDVALICGEPIAGPSFTPCRLDQIPGLRLVIPSDQNAMAKQVRAHIAAGFLTPSKVLRIDSVNAISDLVSTGGWAAFMPISGLLDESQRRGLFIYPIEHPLIVYRLGLIRKQSKPLTAAAEAFVSMIAAFASRLKPTWETLAAQQAQGRYP